MVRNQFLEQPGCCGGSHELCGPTCAAKALPLHTGMGFRAPAPTTRGVPAPRPCNRPPVGCAPGPSRPGPEFRRALPLRDLPRREFRFPAPTAARHGQRFPAGPGRALPPLDLGVTAWHSIISPPSSSAGARAKAPSPQPPTGPVPFLRMSASAKPSTTDGAAASCIPRYTPRTIRPAGCSTVCNSGMQLRKSKNARTASLPAHSI